MTRALITGLCGFCGRHLARRLAEMDGVAIAGIDLAPEPPEGLRLSEYCAADVTEAGSLESVVRKFRPDWVFHLSGISSGDANRVYGVNVLGTVRLLDAVALAAPQAALLLVGSAAEYGAVAPDALPVSEDHPCRPVGAYGTSKFVATTLALEIARRRSLKVVVARPFNIIGAGIPSTLVVGAILDRLRRALSDGGRPVVRMGNLDAQRDFIAVEDAVDAYVRLIQCGRWGEVFNICSGKPYPVRRVVEQLVSFCSTPIEVVVDPALVRNDDVAVIYGDLAKAAGAIGFRPRTTLADALLAAWRDVFGAIG